MSFHVRPCADGAEFAAAITAIGQYFGWHPTEEEAGRFGRDLDRERMHAAWDGDRIIGGAGAFSFDLSVPGGSVPTAGVTVVGVSPTHRRRGALRAMMRAQLDDVRERGEPLAALWASEEAIYGRFGYGMASLQGEASLAREHSAFVTGGEPSGRLRLVERDEALELFPPVWAAVRSERPGIFARRPPWWEHRALDDPPEHRAGAGPKRFAVWENADGAGAYAIYRHEPKWEAGIAESTVRVVEALGTTAEATRAIWRFLLDIDWVATLSAKLLPIDHPLFLLLASPRRMRFRVGDGLWVRLVDVGAALSARAYADGEPIVFEVADAFCPWNEGHWRLEGGVVSRTDDGADIRLDVSALGSVYLGGFTFAQLARASRIEELTPDAATRADRVFATDHAAPWCPEIF